MTITAKKEMILGQNANQYDESKKVILMNRERYTCNLVYDPHYEEYQFRNIRKNNKAKTWEEVL